MPLDPLPKLADPRRLAELSTKLEGEVDLGACARLQEFAPENAGRAQAVFAFSRDAQGRVVMEGEARAALRLVCQRCGEPFLDTHRAEWRVVFVPSEDEERRLAGEGIDAWCQQGLLDVIGFLEEELILALPMAPHHREDCEPGHEPESVAHPFAVLAEWFERDPRET